MNNWEAFFDFVKGRNIALFGNAKSVLRTEKEIDSKYDIICRMNMGFVKGHEKLIGMRTDVLFLSMPLRASVIREINPKFIIWCTPKHEKMTEFIKKRALIYDITWWNKLYYVLKARPSTGMMALDILKTTESYSIHIYGYDHWKSETWYTNKNNPCHHKPKKEEHLVNEIISQSEGRIKKC